MKVEHHKHIVSLQPLIFQISSLASNILILLLKSNMTLHPNHWSYVLGHIIPALPIIQCVTDKETTLGISFNNNYY